MLTQLIVLAVLVVLLLLWSLAWQRQKMLAVGIAIGVALAGLIVASVDTPKLESIPVWLPPLPFAVVAVTLFFFGILAWVWGDHREGEGSPRPSDPPHSH